MVTYNFCDARDAKQVNPGPAEVLQESTGKVMFEILKCSASRQQRAIVFAPGFVFTYNALGLAEGEVYKSTKVYKGSIIAAGTRIP